MDKQRGVIDVFHGPHGRIDAPCGIIAFGDDVWFTSITDARLGRVRPDGAVDLFADPQRRVRLPANIFPGADGRLWFTSLGSDGIGAIDPHAHDPAATIVLFAHPDLRRPVAIKAAASGLIWFTARGSNAVGSLDPRATNPAGTIRLVRSPLIDDPSALFVAADGTVWWVNAGTRTVARLDPRMRDPGASIVVFGPWPSFGAPRAWAQDASGTLWLTTQDAPGLLSIEAAGAASVTVRWVTDDRLRTPDGVWIGRDGAAWLADTEADAIVRHVPGSGDWQQYTSPEVAGPFDIKAGPGGADLWFTNKGGGTIGRIRDGL